MLVSQWRECIAIKRQWEKGSLKHRLVNYILNYDRCFFSNYVRIVVHELDYRNIRYNTKYLDEINVFCKCNIIGNNLIYKEHNNRYFKQCYYNLEEKYDRGIISTKEWIIIKENRLK